MATGGVAYKSEAELPPPLAAPREPRGPGDERVVVDNASRDDSAAVARAGGARVIEMRRNAGFAGGCRAGAEATRAPLLFFCNPDAQPEPGALAQLRAPAASEPGWGA